MTDRLDDAIDGAVREMLDIEPRADLRERVVASAFRRNLRIPVASAFRRNIGTGVASAFRRNIGSGVASAFRRNLRIPVASAFRRNRVLLFATTAAILIALFVARRNEPVAPQAPIVVQGADVRLPSPIVPAPAAEIPIRVARAARTPAPPLGRNAVAAAAIPIDADVTVAGVEPLKGIAPIAIAPITRDSIAPAGLAMTPLNPISEMRIAPLTPPDRRN